MRPTVRVELKTPFVALVDRRGVGSMIGGSEGGRGKGSEEGKLDDERFVVSPTGKEGFESELVGKMVVSGTAWLGGTGSVGRKE